ncbi:hypothetical protein BHM03_00062400 [Ensete ventricosum]|nr:hypothetical protein BHM03_00062400 [Ensete ventricosum]
MDGGTQPSLSAVVAVLVLVSTAVVVATAVNVTTLAFDDGYAPLFGKGNLVRSADGRSVSLLLDRYSGELPPPPTRQATSNGDVFEKSHDELDFEFLGNIRGKEWRVQTNVYGNGSTSRGREERYYLPFDPTADFHRYSILWTADNIIFYVDDTPIREVRRSEAMGGDYPSKPMSLYATIWDASNWATSGGRYKVNYKYAPFVSSFADLTLLGCRLDPIQQVPTTRSGCAAAAAEIAATGLAVMTPEKRRAMRAFRRQYMSYSVCYDRVRYPAPFPECDIVETLKKRFGETGRLRFRRHRRRVPRGGRVPVVADSNRQPQM